MSVLIQTYPPSFNPNYGGILQAWALQHALMGIGHISYVEHSIGAPTKGPLSSVKKCIKNALTLAGSTRYISSPDVYGLDMSRGLLSFAQSSIQQVSFKEYTGGVNSTRRDSIDSFVVGSDQVWRPDYVNVPSFLFDYLASDDPRPRIAYAASFGRATTDGFTRDLVQRTLPLAKRLDFVSVREESGIAIARELWGINAVRMIDPTMLILPEYYEDYFDIPSTTKQEYIASYILDPTPMSTSITTQASQKLSRPVYSLNTPSPTTVADYKKDPDSFRKLSVHEWLRGLSLSTAVVTDSFHGVVFSLLFNKPFLVVVNTTRGATRFDTVLKLFGLQDRAVITEDAVSSQISQPIDWDRVNDTIIRERSEGLSFLRMALS